MTDCSHHYLLHLVKFVLKEFVVAVEDEAFLPENSPSFELDLEKHGFGLKINDLKFNNELPKHRTVFLRDSKQVLYQKLKERIKGLKLFLLTDFKI